MSQESIALDPELREFRENMREKGIAVLRRLGNGGFGEIFIGRTEKDYAGRYVAIKRVVKERAVSSEADALDKYVARVHSQTNLVTVLGNWVFPNGELCYTMELADEANQKKPVERGASLDGYTPDTLLARREAAGSAFSLVEIDGFVQGLLAALALLEKLQLVHRDIKLPNIFFFSQQPVLGDLGCLVQANVVLPSGVAGTWDYLSREQRLKTGQSTCCCYDDLYQLGEVIFRLALPYSAYCEYVKKCKENARRRELTPVPHDGLAEVAGVLPVRHAKLLEDFVTRHACTDNPAKRFHSVAEFRAKWNRLVDRAIHPEKYRRRLMLLGINLLVGAVLVTVLVQLFFAHRLVAQQEQLDAQQEMRRWLMTHPPQASFVPLAEWETPWVRVLFDHDNPYFDPLGGRLDEEQWEVAPMVPKAGPRAVLPPAVQPDTLRELRLTWRGQPLLPEFEVQFLLLAEPSKCRLTLELTPDNPDIAPISFHYVVTHAGFFAENDMAREEGEFIEHGVRLIWSDDELKVVANNTQVEALGRLPAEWNTTHWFLTLRLETREEGEVFMRHLLLFRPVTEEKNEVQ